MKKGLFVLTLSLFLFVSVCVFSGKLASSDEISGSGEDRVKCEVIREAHLDDFDISVMMSREYKKYINETRGYVPKMPFSPLDEITFRFTLNKDPRSLPAINECQPGDEIVEKGWYWNRQNVDMGFFVDGKEIITNKNGLDWEGSKYNCIVEGADYQEIHYESDVGRFLMEVPKDFPDWNVGCWSADLYQGREDSGEIGALRSLDNNEPYFIKFNPSNQDGYLNAMADGIQNGKSIGFAFVDSFLIKLAGQELVEKVIEKKFFLDKKKDVTNCYKYSGDGKATFLGMIGKSAGETPAGFLRQQILLYDKEMGVLGSISFFKENYAKLSFYVDLNLIDDSNFKRYSKLTKINNKPSLVYYFKDNINFLDMSSCAPSRINPAEIDAYTFYHGDSKVYPGYAYTGNGKAIIKYDITSLAGLKVEVHELGHSFCKLDDEYLYSVEMPKNNFPFAQCIYAWNESDANSQLMYKGLRYAKAHYICRYGIGKDKSGKYVEFYRPANISMMFNAYHGFDIPSCAYCLKRINDENAKKGEQLYDVKDYWPICYLFKDVVRDEFANSKK